jgi:hypothetical protein
MGQFISEYEPSPAWGAVAPEVDNCVRERVP